MKVFLGVRWFSVSQEFFFKIYLGSKVCNFALSTLLTVTIT